MEKLILWKNIVRELGDEIGRMRPARGDRFHSLQEVCRKYDVSVITAKRVFSELERQGWISTAQGKRPVITRNHRAVEIKVFLPEHRLSALSNFLVVQIVSGIADAARETGCHTTTFSDPLFLQKAAPDEAVILFAEVFDDAPFAVKEKNVVVVNAYSALETHSSVGTDFKEAEFLAVKHMLSLGHRRIALMNGLLTNRWYTPRYEGYEKSLRSAGIKPEWCLVKETGGADKAEDWRALDELMRLKDPPTAIVTANDFRALHVIDYCAKHDIRIPADLSLAGFDNTPESAAATPALTTVDTGLRRIGRESVLLLLDLVNGKKKMDNVLVKPELVVRKSTARIRRKP